MLSSSKDRLTVLVPAGIGLAANYKKSGRTVEGVQLVRLTKNGSLGDGSLLLELTMKHITEINDMPTNLYPGDKNALMHLLKDLKSRYHLLSSVLTEIETNSKATNLLEFSKKKQLRRDLQELCEAGYRLYRIAKTTSEDLQRAVIAHSVGTIERIQGELPANERVAGISLRLDGLVGQEARVASLLMETTKGFGVDETTRLTNARSRTFPTDSIARMGADSGCQSIASASSPTVPATASNHGFPLPPLAPNLVAANLLNPDSQPGVPHNVTSTACDPTPLVNNLPNFGSHPNARKETPTSPSAVPGTPSNNVPPINTLADFATILPNIPGLTSPSRPSSPPPAVNIAGTHTHTHNYHYYLLLNQNPNSLSQVIGSMESAPVTNFPPPNPTP